VKRLPIFVGGFNVPVLAKTLLKLLSHFKKAKSAIVVGSSPTIALPFLAGICARMLHIPYVLDARDIVGEIAELGSGWVVARLTRWMERMTIRNSNIIFTTSQTQMQMLADLYNVQMEKIHLLPNGIDVSKVKGYIDNKKKEIDFIFLGNLDKTRDPDRLLTFLSVLPKSRQVMFVGDIGIDGFSQKIGKLRCKVTIKRPLQQNEAFVLLQKSKFGLVSITSDEQLRYQLPVKIYEYMAHGLPVVVFGHDIESEARRFVNQNDIGKYFTAPSDFLSWYSQVVSNDKIYRQISEHNIKTAKKFDRKKLIRATTPILKELYGNNH
jgi:glycosyltransferase involved in cell wall biosynthesis